MIHPSEFQTEGALSQSWNHNSNSATVNLYQLRAALCERSVAFCIRSTATVRYRKHTR